MKPRNTNLSSEASTVARVVIGMFGVIFGGIGVTVIAFLWGSPWGAFGSPPLIFRVFGSFIALGFVVFGGLMIFTTIAAGKAIARLKSMHETDRADKGAAHAPCYTCPQCSAPLSESAEVSPHGDVKCAFCACWFNVHGK